MRYKEDNNNRYRVNFMRATEELMDALTVESFISYLEENAEFEDYTVEYTLTVSVLSVEPMISQRKTASSIRSF